MTDLECLILQGYSISAKLRGHDGTRLKPGVGTIMGIYAVSATVIADSPDLRIQADGRADVVGFDEEQNNASLEALKAATKRLREKIEKVAAL